MSGENGLRPQEWLAEIHNVFDSIERDAAVIARSIADCCDEFHAGALRAEWSKFVGHLTELAVVMSDQLQRTANSQGRIRAPRATREGN